MTVLGEPFGQIEGWCERHYELGGLGCKESKFYESERDTYLQGAWGDESNSEQLRSKRGESQAYPAAGRISEGGECGASFRGSESLRLSESVYVAVAGP